MFEVSWCVIGKDPEAEPFLFHTFEEARGFLQSELYWVAGDTEGQAQIEAGIAAAIVKDVEGYEARDFVLTVGDVSYWLIEKETVTWRL